MSGIPNVYTPHCAMCRAGFGKPLADVDPDALCVFHLRGSLAEAMRALQEIAHPKCECGMPSHPGTHEPFCPAVSEASYIARQTIARLAPHA